MNFIETKELETYFKQVCLEGMVVLTAKVYDLTREVKTGIDAGYGEFIARVKSEEAGLHYVCATSGDRWLSVEKRVKLFNRAAQHKQFVLVPKSAATALLCTKVPFTDGYEVEEISRTFNVFEDLTLGPATEFIFLETQ